MTRLSSFGKERACISICREGGDKGRVVGWMGYGDFKGWGWEMVRKKRKRRKEREDREDREDQGSRFAVKRREDVVGERKKWNGRGIVFMCKKAGEDEEEDFFVLSFCRTHVALWRRIEANE